MPEETRITCPDCGTDWQIVEGSTPIRRGGSNPLCRLCSVLSKIKVASEEECEQADVVVCGPTSHFGDDVHSFCSKCGVDIVYRPYVPKKPSKVCMACAELMAKEEKDIVTFHIERM